jgi:hypothetical protein
MQYVSPLPTNPPLENRLLLLAETLKTARRFAGRFCRKSESLLVAPSVQFHDFLVFQQVFLTHAALGLPLRSEHHPPAELPLQAAHRHLRDQGLPPQHLQRLASQQRNHVSGHAARDGVETKHQDLRRAGVCATAVERYVVSQPATPLCRLAVRVDR